MPTLLDMVRIELENTDFKHAIEPNAEVGPQDHKVGTADLEVRKLYSLGMQWDKVARETLLAARYISDKNRQREMITRATEFHEKSDILLSIFWASLKDTFGLWGKPSIGIRSGWHVVWSESEIPPILGILGDLFGGRE
ncbi:MAG: hypothetical protein HYT68_01905 [Candidatus Zambryskibacteria bacterium]|nr:hypothetical protein [Candidatus Zambryskibacteria bacterium]